MLAALTTLPVAATEGYSMILPVVWPPRTARLRLRQVPLQQQRQINAAFAENNIKLKMKVYDTYVLNEEQDTNHLVEIPGRQFQSIDKERTFEILKGKIVEYPGVNESDIVYVFTRRLLSTEGSQENIFARYEDKTGPCGGRLLPNIYYDPPFSYLAITIYVARNPGQDSEHE
ncbi:uncharacterized protein LOC135374059 [Ornithodoros turicata]|uniref:uncharacterized protein LOC135374059 n=1 Tax=Ornithodoros turicata TaxID=34597 RepID=UPI0031387F73